MTRKRNQKRGTNIEIRMPRWLPIAALVCVASVLMLANLGNQYLWEDEAQTALIAKTVLTHGIPLGYDGKNFFSQEKGAEYGKNYVWKWHTWFPFYLLAGFFAVFGVSTFVARLPFALLGIATVVMTYYLGETLWKSKRAGALSAVALMLTVFFLILSRQCRYYSAAAFFSVLSLYAYVEMLKGRKRSGILFVVAATLLFQSHHISCITLLVSIFIHMLLFHRDRLRPVLIASACIVAINLPWMIWLSSASYGRIYGEHMLNLDRPIAMAKGFIAHLWNDAFVPMILVLVVFVAAAGWLRHERRPTPERYAWDGVALLLIFMTVNIIALSLMAPMWFFRYLAPIIPICSLILGLALDLAMDLHPITGFAALAALMVFSPMKDYLYEITHNYDGPIEGIVKYLNRHAKESDLVAITYGDLPLKFYTNMRIVGGLTGEDLSLAKTAKWVIIRRNIASSTGDLGVRLYFMETLNPDDYEPIVLENYPDITWENREEPKDHHFRTVTDEDPVVILRKIKN